MMVLSRFPEILRAGQFIRQVGGLVDQHWQALRADIDFAMLIFDGKQGFLLFRESAIQTNIGIHHYSNRDEITKALVVFERLVFVMLAGIVPEFRIIRPSGKVFLR